MMKMRINSGIFFLASLLAIFLFSAQDLNAQRGRAKASADWDQLGSRIVSKGADHDVIEMNKRDGLYTNQECILITSRLSFRMEMLRISGSIEILMLENGVQSLILLGTKDLLTRSFSIIIQNSLPMAEAK
jgi:hypothetical protein